MSNVLGMNLIEANQQATALLRLHGLTDQGWRIQWENTRGRAGVCHYNTRTIAFSRIVFRHLDDALALNTVLHEIAHALTPGHQHDAVWAAKHREIGGNGKRSIDDQTIARAAAKWLAECRVTRQVIGGSNRLTQGQKLANCRCHGERALWVPNN